MKLQMIESKGPKLYNPIRNVDHVNKLNSVDPYKELKYVLDAVSLTKRELNGRVPLIGFAGSPWTLMTYMVEGGGSKNFSEIKKFIYNQPDAAHKLLDLLADIVANYLSAKIESGANAVQIFDTWGGILSPDDFAQFSLQYITKVISKIKRSSEPVIVFAKGVHYKLDDLASCGADVIGLDWTMNLKNVRNMIGSNVALQGNLDPTILYSPKEKILNEALKVLESFGKGNGHIFNLGHGILPDVNPDHLKYLVEVVKKESVRFH